MTATHRDVVARLTARYDYLDPAFTPEVAESVDRNLRESPGVPYSAAHGGMWILARYENVRAALKDHQTFSSAAGVFFPRPSGTPRFAPIEYDPPEHGPLRRLMAPPLMAEQLRRLEPAMKALAERLIRPLASRGGGDIPSDLARPFSIGALALAIGLSEPAQAEILELTRSLFVRLATRPDLTEFWPAFHELVSAEVRRARAGPGDSYLARLADTEVDGKPISDETLQSIVVSYCIAGHQTTMNAISRMLWHLAGNPPLQQQLAADSHRRPVAVDETLRRWCPTDRFTRVTTRDVTIDGARIPHGSRVVLLIDAANRDPAKFAAPDEFSLERGNAHQHLSFGFGPHHCIGANLARLQLRTILDELARHPGYTLSGEPRHYIENGRNAVFEKVPVQFTTAVSDSEDGYTLRRESRRGGQ